MNIHGINLGCGNWNYPGWIGLDTVNGNILDKNTILPYKNKSIKYIYSSHFLEHIDDETAINLLKESYRILENDGIIRLTTPHYEELYNRCKQNDINWYKKNRIIIPRRDWKALNIENNIQNTLVHYMCNYHDGEPAVDAPNVPSTNKLRTVIPKLDKAIIIEKLDELNVGEFCNWCLSKCPEIPISDKKLDELKKKKFRINFVGNGKQHINWWTYQKFKKILTKIGFRDIIETTSNKSSIPGPFTKHIESFRGAGSIWIECRK